MEKDLAGALILAGVFVFMVATKTRAPDFIHLMAGSRQVSTVVILGGVAFLYTKGYHKTALVAGLLSVYLMNLIWMVWPRGDDNMRLHVDRRTDEARFDPSTSIDLQFANRTTVHNLPVLLVKPLFHDDLLTFPPSPETLAEMSG
jgi:hypothetical protein